jgi:RNA polymerase sigma factor for flagellar operon FliA
VESAIASLESTLHRTPTDEELADALEISGTELQRWLAGIAVANVGPLEHLMATGRGEVTASTMDGTPGLAIEERELRHAMRAEVRRLPERERTVIALYYAEGLTLHEIGDVLGVTESRVSQIHTKAVLILRSRLNAAGH